MTHKRINPENLYNTQAMGYSHAVRSQSSVMVHCSGQVAWDKNNKLVGENDIELQARQALSNLKVVLQEAGAKVEDVVQLRIYVVNHNPALLEPIAKTVAEFYDGIVPAASTLIGVQALALPEFLIEVEAIAAVE